MLFTYKEKKYMLLKFLLIGWIIVCQFDFYLRFFRSHYFKNVYKQVFRLFIK